MPPSPDAETPTLGVGSVLNEKWRIDSILGKGGMATVYAATHRNRKRAAIKVLRRELSIDPEIRQRFVREGYVANSIEHRGVVRVDDDDVAQDGSAYLVMELLDGADLDSLAERAGGCLPVDLVVSVTMQLLDVLALAHSRGVVHRDIKPANLFMLSDRSIKVLDFGIARLRESEDSTSVTVTGALLGTPVFMAPEQARGRWNDVDERTDIWAVGATVFTLLSGRFVHATARTLQEALSLAMSVPAPRLETAVPDIDPKLASIIDRALAFDKADRWATARAMQAALDVWLDSESTAIQRVIVPGFSTAERVSHPQLFNADTVASGPEHSAPAATLGGSVAPTKTIGRKPRVVIVGATLLALGAIGIGAWKLLGAEPDRGSAISSGEPNAAAPPALSASVQGHVTELAPAASVLPTPSASVALPPPTPRKSTPPLVRATAKPSLKPSAKPAAPAPPEDDPYAIRR